MKNLIVPIMLGLFILFLSSGLQGQTNEIIEKYSKVKINIQYRTDLKELQKVGLSLEGMRLEEQSVELILSKRDIIKLDDLGYSYQILIDDMAKYYEERSRRTDTEMKNLERKMKEKYSYGGFGFGSMGGFYAYDEVVAELDTMRMLYPNLITAKYSIGTTLEGRTIWAVKISDNPDITEGEPEVFYNSLVHAREPEGMMSVIYFMYYLLEHYGSDPEVTYLVDNRELYFVPVINPDGYVYNQQTNPNGGGMWRKNRKDNGNGCFGVDINRNFGYMWAYNNIGSNPDPCNLEFRGTNAFSEIESQSVRDFCNSRDFKLAINFHTYSNLLLYPWDYINSPTVDSSWFVECSSLMVTYNGYEAGQSPVILYEFNGSATDWMYGEQTTKPKIFAYATEVGNNNDGFWPVPERIFPLAEENVYLNKVLAWGLGVIENPPYISDVTITPTFCRPFLDTLMILAFEKNPDGHTSNVIAQVLTLNDSLISEFQLNQSDSSFTGSFLINSNEEKYYKIILQQNGIDIPSKLFNSDLRFTTVGPAVLDSISCIKTGTYYAVKTFVRNQSSNTTITNASVKLICSDPWVLPISPDVRDLPNIPPGGVVKNNFSFAVRVTDSLFLDNRFNFKVEIMSDGWTYWTDSTQVIITGVEAEVTEIPTDLALSQYFPNPFNPSTTIKYAVPQSSQVQIKVFDVLGNEIETLVNEEKPVGTYELTWDAENLPSGVYFYQLRAGDYTATRKMILLK